MSITAKRASMRPALGKLRRLLSLRETEAAGSDWSTQCLNCGAPLASTFCPDCGQRALPPNPTMKELAGDAFAELSGWDGKFIETFQILLLKPGELTKRFIEGQRVRYIAPVRLYLTLSLLYFVAGASSPAVKSRGAARLEVNGTTVDFMSGFAKGYDEAGRDAHKGEGSGSNPSTVDRLVTSGVAGSRVAKNAADSTAQRQERRDSLDALINRMPALLRPSVRRAAADPNAFKRSFTEMMPRALFVLLPVFAGILALFYWRRNYPEHLYFAIHVHAFVFLVLLIAELMTYSHRGALIDWTRLLALLSIPIYTTIAMKRVYGGSLAMTILKEVGIAAIYTVASLTALTAAAIAVGFVS